MSVRRNHPIHVVRFDRGYAGCGHQHDTAQQARNCAANNLKAHPTIPDATVVRIKYGRLSGSISEKDVTHVTR